MFNMIDVTCAIIRNEEEKVLIVQRGSETDHPFKWEFPGGKLAKDETVEECILREIREELSMEIVIFSKLPPVEHDYGYKRIRLIPFICDTLDEVPFLSEHIDYKWLDSKDLDKIDFSDADVFVAKMYLEKFNDKNESEVNTESESSVSLTEDSDLKSMVNRMMSMKEAEWVAVSAIENPAIFSKLIEYSFSQDKKLGFHASWTLTKVCDKYPEIIHPYLGQMVDSLKKLENESALRSFLRILSLTDLSLISEPRHGLLADFCFGSLNSGLSAIAVKAYSMEILYRLSQIYPELATELSVSIRILIEDSSAGITSRGRMILKKLSEMPINQKNNQL